MITGREMSLFGSCLRRERADDSQGQDSKQRRNQRAHGAEPPRADPADDDETTGVFYFIHRILKRTQLSCTTLVLALIYIDRFKARLSRSLNKKNRTRLDQGPDHGHALTSSTTSFWTRRSHRNKDSFMSGNGHSHGDISRPSTPTDCYSSNSTSPTSSISTTTSSIQSNRTNNSQNREQPEPWSSISLILVAFICADKYLFDATFSNAEWADFTRGQYTTKEINDLERRFLGHLDYKLYVSEQDFDGFLAYLEVVLTLKRVWGRGLMAAFSYTDVRILSQRLLPAYADRLQFRALQVDMVAVLWQVMAAISRVYLTIVGTVIFAAASYTAMVELSSLTGVRNAAKDALAMAPRCLPSLPGSDYLPSLHATGTVGVAEGAGAGAGARMGTIGAKGGVKPDAACVTSASVPHPRASGSDGGGRYYTGEQVSGTTVSVGAATSLLSWMPASPTLVHVQFVECH